MNEGKTSKRLVCVRLELTLCKAIERKYAKEGDENKSVAYIRALEDATRKVILTAEDYRQIAEEVERNEKARIAKRRNRK